MNKSRLDHWIRILIICLAVGILLCALLLILLGWSKEEPAPKPRPEAAEAGLTTSEELQPDISKLFIPYGEASLTDTLGQPVRLEAYQGRPLVIYFWSSWCKDCTAYTDRLPQVAQAVEEAGGQFVMACRTGIRGETVDSATAYLKEQKLALPDLYDENAELYTALGLKQVPSLAFFSAEGVLMNAVSLPIDPTEAAARTRYAAGETQAQTWAFTIQRLMNEQGGVCARYGTDALGQVISQGAYLSETQGIVMEYAAMVKDKVAFDKAFGFARIALQKSGLFAWQQENGQAGEVNATLDDLRILRALLMAEEAWGGYEAAIQELSWALLDKVTEDDTLRDFAQLEGEGRSAELTLCYIDVSTLQALAKLDSRWEPVLESARQVLTGGVISDDFPLYVPRYSYEKGEYDGDELHTAEALVTIKHLVESGLAEDGTLDFLEKWVSSGPVYARYDLKGRPLEGYQFESTAVYALLAQIGSAAGRKDMALEALRRMEKQRQWDPGSLAGSYGKGQTVYTFDTLEALMAWESLKE